MVSKRNIVRQWEFVDATAKGWRGDFTQGFERANVFPFCDMLTVFQLNDNIQNAVSFA